jgi:hypothetical protein
MKTPSLIDRMSIEALDKLESYTKVYPNSGNALMLELSKIEYWTNLTYEYICVLNDALDCGYRPAQIDNLFNKQ